MVSWGSPLAPSPALTNNHDQVTLTGSKPEPWNFHFEKLVQPFP